MSGYPNLPDYDVPGASWQTLVTIGSPYEEQFDISRAHGKWRHRMREVGDEPHLPWQEGRAPWSPPARREPDAEVRPKVQQSMVGRVLRLVGL